jgi:hypothetical protein
MPPCAGLSRRVRLSLLACAPLWAACADAPPDRPSPPPPTAAQAPPPPAARPSEPSEPAAPAPAPTAPQAEPRFRVVEHPRTPVARAADGCSQLELDREWHTLRYRRGSAPGCPAFAQDVELVHEMVLAFDALGDLRDVTSLVLGRDYPAFFERVALAAASSPGWDAKRGEPRGASASAVNAFVVNLAQDPARFFPEITTVLRGTPMRAELRSVEKVLVAAAKSTPFAEPLARHGVAPTAKLPVDCIVAFALVNADSTP